MKYTERIEGDFLIREYENGTVVKTPVQKETEGEIIPLPKNPLLEAQEEIKKVKKELSAALLDSATGKARIQELEKIQANLLKEIALLKGGNV